MWRHGHQGHTYNSQQVTAVSIMQHWVTLKINKNNEFGILKILGNTYPLLGPLARKGPMMPITAQMAVMITGGTKASTILHSIYLISNTAVLPRSAAWFVV